MKNWVKIVILLLIVAPISFFLHITTAVFYLIIGITSFIMSLFMEKHWLKGGFISLSVLFLLSFLNYSVDYEIFPWVIYILFRPFFFLSPFFDAYCNISIQNYLWVNKELCELDSINHYSPGFYYNPIVGVGGSVVSLLYTFAVGVLIGSVYGKIRNRKLRKE